MSISSTLFHVAQLIYPLPPPSKKRTKELRVLCLGLPRSATESLNHALQLLGYSGVSHGIPWWLHHPEHSVKYHELALLSQQGRTPNADLLRKEFFDRILGDFEATTDIPSAWFAEELLRAYPDAAVILNRRSDVGAWKTSFRNSVQPVLQSWKYWFWSWFDAELFWLMSLTYQMHTRKLFGGKFEANAEDTYQKHYERLERELEDAKRPFLRWSVEDGWETLCAFLERPVPDVKFPEGNIASEFGPRLMARDRDRMANARTNATWSLVLVAALTALSYHWML